MAKANGTKAAKTVSFRMDEDTHNKLKTYSDLTGVPMFAVAARAIKEWMDVTGEIHMQVLSEKFSGKPLLISEPLADELLSGGDGTVEGIDNRLAAPDANSGALVSLVTAPKNDSRFDS